METRELNLTDNFKCEIELKDTRFPLPKTTIYSLLGKINIFNGNEDSFSILQERLEELVREHFKDKPKQMLLMQYCKTEEEKEKCKVFLNDDCLCFYRDGKYVRIDSQNLFREYFGRIPLEDDEYLKSIGFPSLPERQGKSCFSCFTIHKDGNLYIHPYRQDTIQHTFTTNGRSVAAAGLIILVDGKILHINNVSGHYKTPNQYIELFFDFLKNSSITENLNLYFHHDFSVFRNNFSFPLSRLIENKEFGISFKYLFREKTLTELEEERHIRNQINQKYLKSPKSLAI